MTEHKAGHFVTAAQHHAIEWLPGWEYETTWAYLGDWPGRDTPPEGAGWVRNVEAGEQGYQEKERIQVSYWRRPKP